MVLRRLGLGALSALFILVNPANAQEDLTALADPFVGVDGGGVAGGNTVPGAGVPFGFVSLSPDTSNGDTNGYESKGSILGFSFTHVSGTGGSGKYGNFRTVGFDGPLMVNHMVFAKDKETASPGYYAVSVGNAPKTAVYTELTAARLSGFQRFTYKPSQNAHIVMDVTSVVALRGRGQRVKFAHVEAINDHTLSGYVTVEGGWNPLPYTLYFYAEFDRSASDFGVWKARQGQMTAQSGVGIMEGGDQTKSDENRKGLMIEYDTAQEFSNKIGAYARFDTTQNQVVQMRLGVSFVGVAKAKQNLEQELPDWDFDAAHMRASDEWQSVLSKIDVQGGSETDRRIFYTALYHTHTMPHDLSGDNVWWKSDEPHYEDFYTLWDTFRTVHPLLTLIQPQRQRDMIRSLVDTYVHTGWMPDSRISGHNGMTQGGSNGDIVIADAVVKDLGGFDYELAYQAIKKNGDVTTDAPFLQGRVLEDYLKLGYVSVREPRSASRTLEYAANDFAIAQVAQKLGHKDDAKRFLARSGNWKNLWDDKLGCIRPRYENGQGLENFTCTYEYPDKSTPWWEAPFYEGNSLQFSTYVPQDVTGLIAKVGGNEAFVVWLDRLFDGHYSQSNEPDILAPYLYIHAGRPDKTQERVRYLMKTFYHLDRHGLPGNDDAGAMSSWYVWGAIGLYPNAGQAYYYIGSPIFKKSTIHLEQGRSFSVLAANTDEMHPYVKGAKLNGKPIDRAWLTHKEVSTGGVLELEMSETPSQWARTFVSPDSKSKKSGKVRR